MYLFADIIQGKFLRENIIWDSSVKESMETPLYGNKTFSNANPITDMMISICSPTQVHIFRRITFSTFMNIDQLKAKKVSSHGNFMRSFLSISHILQKLIIHEYKVCFP
jgi:hypothetical protein